MFILTAMSGTLAIFGVLTIYDALIAKRWYHFLAGTLTIVLACAALGLRVALFGE